MSYQYANLTRKQQEKQIIDQEAMQQRRERFRQAGNMTSSQIDRAVKGYAGKTYLKGHANPKNDESGYFQKHKNIDDTHSCEGITKEDYLIKKHLGGVSFAKLIQSLDPTSLGHISVNKLTKFLRGNQLNQTLLTDQQIANAVNRRIKIADGVPISEAGIIDENSKLNKLTYKQLSQLLRVETDFLGEREIAKIYTQNTPQTKEQISQPVINYEDDKIEFNEEQKLNALKYELSERMQTRYGNVQKAIKRIQQVDGSIHEKDLNKFLNNIMGDVGQENIELIKQDLTKSAHPIYQKLFPNTEERLCSSQSKAINKIMSGDDLQNALDFSKEDAMLFRRNEEVIANIHDKQLDIMTEEQNQNSQVYQSKNFGEQGQWEGNRILLDTEPFTLNKAGQEAIENAEKYTESLNQVRRQKLNYEPTTSAKKDDIMTKDEYDQHCKQNQEKIMNLFKQVADLNQKDQKGKRKGDNVDNVTQNYIQNKFNQAKMKISNFYFTDYDEWPKRPEGFKIKRAKSSFDYYQDKDYYWNEERKQNIQNADKQRFKDRDIQPIRHLLYSAYPKGCQSVRLAHDLLTCQEEAKGDFNVFKRNLENIGAGILGQKDCQWLANQCIEDNHVSEHGKVNFNVNRILDRLGLQLESQTAKENLYEFKQRKSSVQKISEGHVGLPLFRMGELQNERQKRLQGEYGVKAQKDLQREIFRDEHYGELAKNISAQRRTSKELLGALSQEPDRLPPPISAYFNEEQKKQSMEKFIKDNTLKPMPPRTPPRNFVIGTQTPNRIKDRRSFSTHNNRLSHTRIFDASPGAFGGLQPKFQRPGLRPMEVGSQVGNLIDERKWLPQQETEKWGRREVLE